MSLTLSACSVLSTPSSGRKASLSHEVAAAWRNSEFVDVGKARPSERPARPDQPVLLPPGEMPRRRGAAGHIALLHAVAHIELNAIDLAWDMIARFASPNLPRAFYDDWVRVADEEAKHFGLLEARLEALGAAYGDLPAHDGLWKAAQNTAHDVLARLAIAPLVLEARGLDVTPAMIIRLEKAGDAESAAVLRIILRDEVGHVAVGQKWFAHIARERELPPADTFRALVRQYYKGRLKPPFNTESRKRAGFDATWYEPLVEPA